MAGNRKKENGQKKRVVRVIRGILVLAGLSLLVLAVVLLFRVHADLGKEQLPETPAEVKHRVLFLSSYNPLYFTAADQITGLQEGLYPGGVEYDVIYLDTKIFPEEQSFSAWKELIRERLSANDRSYEALITADDAALHFVLDCRQELFPDLPVVFFGVNDLEFARAAVSEPGVTGFYERNYLEQTLMMADALFPDASLMVAVHDSSSAGLSDKKLFLDYAVDHPDKHYTDLNTEEMTHEELTAALDELAEGTVLVYMTCYTDRDGKMYSMQEMTRVIEEHAGRLPIFRNYDGGIGGGVLGGVSVDFVEHSRLAGERVCEILNGRGAAAFGLDEDTPYRCQFDYKQLAVWGLEETELPPGTLILNQPVTFVQEYRPIIVPAILILAAVVLILASAEIANQEMKRTNAELSASKKALEESEENLRYRAEHDGLLGVLNRRTMIERMHSKLTMDDVYSMMMLNLDGFKRVNEEYGHRASDHILKHFAKRLNALAEKYGWWLARYEGDEFLILVLGEHVTAEHMVTEEIMACVRTPIRMGEVELKLTASIGISHSDGVTEIGQNIDNAENALDEAKTRGRDCAFVFAEEMKARLREENRVKEKLAKALDEHSFFMVYQPQINTKTREVCGYEALVRMQEPGIYPGQFIPVAEKNGWIWRIGRITTELVIRQLAAWRDAGHELKPVSINYSSNQLNDTGYQYFLEGLLKKYDIPASYIEIEITEGLFLDRTAQAENLFERFHQLGIRLLMDDFGTGYSSLGYLTYIPIDAIKLDKSLVDTYLVDGRDGFVRDVIQLVHDLGKEMIIEGVEEAWQYERLLAFGADTIQGYYFSKPIPPEEAITFKVPEKEEEPSKEA